METNDKVFGKIKYDHRWEKKKKIHFDGEEIEIKIIAKAFSQKSITDEQRRSYEKVFSNFDEVIKKVESSIIRYRKEHNKEIGKNGNLKEVVVPKSMIFTRSGDCYMLFDCKWDAEGIGVGIIPETFVDSQAAFM